MGNTILQTLCVMTHMQFGTMQLPAVSMHGVHYQSFKSQYTDQYIYSYTLPKHNLTLWCALPPRVLSITPKVKEMKTHVQLLSS